MDTSDTCSAKVSSQVHYLTGKAKGGVVEYTFDEELSYHHINKFCIKNPGLVTRIRAIFLLFGSIKFAETWSMPSNNGFDEIPFFNRVFPCGNRPKSFSIQILHPNVLPCFVTCFKTKSIGADESFFDHVEKTGVSWKHYFNFREQSLIFDYHHGMSYTSNDRVYPKKTYGDILKEISHRTQQILPEKKEKTLVFHSPSSNLPKYLKAFLNLGISDYTIDVVENKAVITADL